MIRRCHWIAPWILFCFFAGFPLFSFAAGQEKSVQSLKKADTPRTNVTITIQGLQGPLHDNVAVALKEMQEKGISDNQIIRLFNLSEKNVRDALEPYGYYSPVIEKKLARSAAGWGVTYRIDPGDPIVVSALDIDFQRKSSTELFPHGVGFPLQKGQRLDQMLYEQGKKTLLSRLVAEGYVKARFTENRIEVDRVNKTCRILLKVDPGSCFLFGDIRFQQDFLDENLLKKYLNFKKGEPYSSAKLLQLEQILYKTGYFAVARVRGDVTHPEKLFVPVLVTLERVEHLNRYHIGIGASTDDGFRGKVGWQNKLLNRYGHTLSAEIQRAEKETGFDTTYTIPVFDPNLDTLYISGSRKDQSWGDTDILLTRGSVYWGHEGSLFRYGGGVDLRDEIYDVGDTSGESQIVLPYANIAVLYGDSFVDTQNGIVLSAAFKSAVNSFLSDTSFFQTTVSGKLIMSPYPGLRLIGRFSFGRILTDDFDEVPPSLRYYAGGDLSIRGFAYNVLGPENENGDVVGGEYLVFGSLEIEKTLYKSWAGAVFYDTGNAMDDLNVDLARSVGVGLRYRLPFGQIRVDLASAISEDGNPFRLHVTVGGDL